MALYCGSRGLPGGSSLARLLAAERGVRNSGGLPAYAEQQILVWADAHHARTGRWPVPADGSILEAPGETWYAVASALSNGFRGLPGGSSLPRLLAAGRGVRNRRVLPPLTEGQILAWVHAFHERSGRWPNSHSGTIPEAAGESWSAVDAALSQGRRGLAGGTSLARLIEAAGGVRNHTIRSPLTLETILAWADAHHARTGTWPNRFSGPIPEAPGESWAKVAVAMYEGLRGLPAGKSLAQLLEEERGRHRYKALLRRPPHAIQQLLTWADAHYARTGRWPRCRPEPIPEAPGEHWRAIDQALRQGARGLPGGSSLYKLLAEHRAARRERCRTGGIEHGC
jgi:hypothetical protein